MIVKRIQDVMSRSQFYDLLNTIHALKQDTFDYYTTVPEYLLDQCQPPRPEGRGLG